MGIESNAIQFLCAAKNYGVEFDDVLMFGRQTFFPTAPALARVFQALDVKEDPVSFHERTRFAEPFFELLGAKRVRSLDYSDFEGAEVIHDMNQPLPAEMRNQAGVVFDGGSIEHVFHVSQALKNLMELVRVGGWFMQITPANNFMGHGFWQLCPEVAYRAFTPENGFERPIVFVKEWSRENGWYAAKEPAKIGRRVELQNVDMTQVFTMARKTADVEVFKTPPLESDYQALWEEAHEQKGIPEKAVDDGKQKVVEKPSRPASQARALW